VGRAVNIAMICYASVGGSGVVATELAKALASREHQVHLISSEPPFRLGDGRPGLRFHQVETPTYPLFREPQYLLSLANTVVQVGRGHQVDIIHAHYAVPHATAAFLAREVLRSSGSNPGVVTTLHGTDITLVGNDRSYSEIVAFSIERSDGVTAVSESLRAATRREVGIEREITVIPNFLDCAVHRRVETGDLRRRFVGTDERIKIVIHISNLRPVKRVPAVVRIFDRIRRHVPARLLLVGDGPELAPALDLAHTLGIFDLVYATGAHQDILPLLSVADVFLLPSMQESFGLAALEAMACEVPVVASNVGGLPEVIEHGVTGFLHDPEDLDGMAASANDVLTNAARHGAITRAARERVNERFCEERVVPMYEALYNRVLA
jgi:N-acetyl-alpha-D-glucosaminyl L-malate synthase BshA